jgi:hypothetical protein
VFSWEREEMSDGQTGLAFLRTLKLKKMLA